jgi:hypothetical protein
MECGGHVVDVDSSSNWEGGIVRSGASQTSEAPYESACTSTRGAVSLDARRKFIFLRTSCTGYARIIHRFSTAGWLDGPEPAVYAWNFMYRLRLAAALCAACWLLSVRDARAADEATLVRVF